MQKLLARSVKLFELTDAGADRGNQFQTTEFVWKKFLWAYFILQKKENVFPTVPTVTIRTIYGSVRNTIYIKAQNEAQNVVLRRISVDRH